MDHDLKPNSNEKKSLAAATGHPTRRSWAQSTSPAVEGALVLPAHGIRTRSPNSSSASNGGTPKRAKASIELMYQWAPI